MGHQAGPAGSRTTEVLRYRSTGAVRAPLWAAHGLLWLAFAGAFAASGSIGMAGLMAFLIVVTARAVARGVVEIDVEGDTLLLRTALELETSVPMRSVESIHTGRWSGTRLVHVDGRSWTISVSGAFAALLDELHRVRPGVGVAVADRALRSQRFEQRLADRRDRYPWIHAVSIGLTVLALVGLNTFAVLGSDSPTGASLFVGSGVLLCGGVMLAPTAFAVAPELEPVERSVVRPVGT